MIEFILDYLKFINLFLELKFLFIYRFVFIF